LPMQGNDGNRADSWLGLRFDLCHNVKALGESSSEDRQKAVEYQRRDRRSE
jgi:hypothetical protein